MFAHVLESSHVLTKCLNESSMSTVTSILLGAISISPRSNRGFSFLETS